MHDKICEITTEGRVEVCLGFEMCRQLGIDEVSRKTKNRHVFKEEV